MIIQPILFPPNDLIKEPELFFNCVESMGVSNDKVVIPAGSELSLGTYFNAFSIGKWLEYTKLDNLFLSFPIVLRSLEELGYFPNQRQERKVLYNHNFLN